MKRKALQYYVSYQDPCSIWMTCNCWKFFSTFVIASDYIPLIVTILFFTVLHKSKWIISLPRTQREATVDMLSGFLLLPLVEIACFATYQNKQKLQNCFSFLAFRTTKTQIGFHELTTGVESAKKCCFSYCTFEWAKWKLTTVAPFAERISAAPGKFQAPLDKNVFGYPSKNLPLAPLENPSDADGDNTSHPWISKYVTFVWNTFDHNLCVQQTTQVHASLLSPVYQCSMHNLDSLEVLLLSAKDLRFGWGFM